MMIKRISVYLIVVKLAVLSVFAQKEFNHPRGIITQNEVQEIREKVKREPFKTWFEKMKTWFEKMKTTTVQAEKELDISDAYQPVFLAQKQAQLYFLGDLNLIIPVLPQAWHD